MIYIKKSLSKNQKFVDDHLPSKASFCLFFAEIEQVKKGSPGRMMDDTSVSSKSISLAISAGSQTPNLLNLLLQLRLFS